MLSECEIQSRIVVGQVDVEEVRAVPVWGGLLSDLAGDREEWRYAQALSDLDEAAIGGDQHWILSVVFIANDQAEFVDLVPQLAGERQQSRGIWGDRRRSEFYVSASLQLVSKNSSFHRQIIPSRA